MAASAFSALYVQNGASTFELNNILLLYFSGGLLAWPLALFLARLSARHRPVETRFAAFLFCLTIVTIAATALLFALQYRIFFSRWHQPFGTRIWMYQFVFTSLGAIYQFVVMGVRLFLPLGFAALLGASLWLAAKERPQRRV